MSRQWSPGSWREFSAKQLPVYADKEKLTRVSQQLHDLPPLVHRSEVDKLTSLLAEAAAGKRFVLWGGDCAEEFRDTNARSIETKFRILLQMSLVLIFEGRLPVVRIGRVAGQYGKPRTADTETLADGRVVKSYKVMEPELVVLKRYEACSFFVDRTVFLVRATWSMGLMSMIASLMQIACLKVIFEALQR